MAYILQIESMKVAWGGRGNGETVDCATHLVDWIRSRHDLALIENEVVVVGSGILLWEVTHDVDFVAAIGELSEQRLKGTEVRDCWVREQTENSEAVTLTASQCNQ